MIFGKIIIICSIIKKNLKCTLRLVQLIVFGFWVMVWDYIGLGRVPKCYRKNPTM